MTDGQAAYEAYGNYVGWVNHQGNPMPQWDELPEKIQGGWNAAAETIVDRV
jgi:hypothetical protein